MSRFTEDDHRRFSRAIDNVALRADNVMGEPPRFTRGQVEKRLNTMDQSSTKTKQYEYRIIYSLSSNITATNERDVDEDWLPVDWMDEDTISIRAILNYFYNEPQDAGPLPHGLQEALDLAGFDWRVEVRPVKR